MTENETDQLPVEEEVVKLDIDKIKENLPKYSSEKLCEMIACNRYFGMDQQIGVICMQELANRRIAGDTFPFEQHIEESFNKLPPLNFGIPDLRTALTQLVNVNKK